MALAVVVLWFGLVAVYLVRQWWVSELAQVRHGVAAPAPVPLPAAPAVERSFSRQQTHMQKLPVAVPAAAAVEQPAPAFAWSTLHVAGSAAR